MGSNGIGELSIGGNREGAVGAEAVGELGIDRDGKSGSTGCAENI